MDSDTLKGTILLVILFVFFGIIVPFLMKRSKTDDDFGTKASDGPDETPQRASETDTKTTRPRRRTT